MLEEGATARYGRPQPPSLRGVVVERGVNKHNFVELEWTIPDDGGDELLQYIVQACAYAIQIDNSKQPAVFFEGFLPFTTVHTQSAQHDMPPAVTLPPRGELRPDNDYRFRVAAANAVGTSQWSNVVEVRAPSIRRPPHRVDPRACTGYGRRRRRTRELGVARRCARGRASSRRSLRRRCRAHG